MVREIWSGQNLSPLAGPARKVKAHVSKDADHSFEGTIVKAHVSKGAVVKAHVLQVWWLVHSSESTS